MVLGWLLAPDYCYHKDVLSGFGKFLMLQEIWKDACHLELSHAIPRTTWLYVLRIVSLSIYFLSKCAHLQACVLITARCPSCFTSCSIMTMHLVTYCHVTKLISELRKKIATLWMWLKWLLKYNVYYMYGVPPKVWCLMVSIPDLCLLPYFYYKT